MYSQEAIIKAPTGIHVRPASQIVKKAKEFVSDVTVTSNGTTVSAKSLSKLQTLDLPHGTVVTITAEGEDEQQAVEELCRLIPSL
ncbi:Phosphocarrier protein HPr, partial [Aspergillus bertholletiae]